MLIQWVLPTLLVMLLMTMWNLYQQQQLRQQAHHLLQSVTMPSALCRAGSLVVPVAVLLTQPRHCQLRENVSSSAPTLQQSQLTMHRQVSSLVHTAQALTMSAGVTVPLHLQLNDCDR
jgi:hypothetical protein